MKVVIREPADGEPVRGYLPLVRETDGVWHAITDRPVPTAEDAVDICIEHLHTAVWKLTADAQEVFERLQNLQHNLRRLRQSPGKGDRVIVRGQRCPVAEDRSIVMPPDDRDETGPWPMPGLAIDVPIDAALTDLLRRATGEPDASRERLLHLIGDMLEQEPTDLLLAVGETAPDQLGRVAELMFAVGQARGWRSGWARASHDGVVQRAIDDESPASQSAHSDLGDAEDRPVGQQGNGDDNEST